MQLGFFHADAADGLLALGTGVVALAVLLAHVLVHFEFGVHLWVFLHLVILQGDLLYFELLLADPDDITLL